MVMLFESIVQPHNVMDVEVRRLSCLHIPFDQFHASTGTNYTNSISRAGKLQISRTSQMSHADCRDSLWDEMRTS